MAPKLATKKKDVPTFNARMFLDEEKEAYFNKHLYKQALAGAQRGVLMTPWTIDQVLLIFVVS